MTFKHTKDIPDSNIWICIKYLDYLKQDVSNFNLPGHLDRQKLKFEFKHDKPKIQKGKKNKNKKKKSKICRKSLQSGFK